MTVEESHLSLSESRLAHEAMVSDSLLGLDDEMSADEDLLCWFAAASTVAGHVPGLCYTAVDQDALTWQSARHGRRPRDDISAPKPVLDRKNAGYLSDLCCSGRRSIKNRPTLRTPRTILA